MSSRPMDVYLAGFGCMSFGPDLLFDASQLFIIGCQGDKILMSS